MVPMCQPLVRYKALSARKVVVIRIDGLLATTRRVSDTNDRAKALTPPYSWYVRPPSPPAFESHKLTCYRARYENRSEKRVS